MTLMTGDVDYGHLLLSGRGTLVVWGLGYIGYSSLAAFSEADVRCIGVDIDPGRVASVNAGEPPFRGEDPWLEDIVSKKGDHNHLCAVLSSEIDRIRDPLVHLVAVPSERDGRPWLDAVGDVVERVTEIPRTGDAQTLIIIESTLSPGTTNALAKRLRQNRSVALGEDVLFAVAPRRDWFASDAGTLASIDRIVGGVNERSVTAAASVVRLVCSTVHKSSDHRTAEYVKCVENAFRHVAISLANQLAMACRDVDVIEVLRLAATKWNMDLFHPGIGVGGYCIPVSSKYVLDGVDYPEELSLLTEAIRVTEVVPERVADALVERGVRTVLLLGLSYRGNTKVHNGSPSVRLATLLLSVGVDVKVADPYYSPSEILSITGCEAVQIPRDLQAADAVVVAAAHNEFVDQGFVDNVISTASPWIVFDHTGCWERFSFPVSMHYYRIGSPGWRR